jgi:glycosyltransferase involved in cell wall biosynthesis
MNAVTVNKESLRQNQAGETLSVLVIGSVYPRFHEDSEVPWLRASVRELVKRGCAVAVAAPSHKGLKSHAIDGVRVHRFRYAPGAWEMLTHDEGAPSKMARNPFLQLLAVPYIISGAVKTLSLCLKLKPDIMHVHWPFPHAFMAGFAAFFCRRVKVVLNFHGAELLLAKKKKWIRPILRRFIKKADAVIANSSFTAKTVKGFYNREVEVIPYGTTLRAPDDGRAYGRGGGKFRVLFVGRHIERKGIEYLIRAAALLDADRFQVRIVGHGDLTEMLKELAEREAPGRVVFLGKLPNDALEKEYEGAGCFVLPAIVDSRGDTEGLGVVLIEAAECRVPIVASGVGGIVDVVIDGKTGFLVAEKSPRELADAVLKLYNDEGLCRELAANCKAHVNEFFSWVRITDSQIALYKRFTTIP